MSVYKAINAVQTALAAEGISKSRNNTQQGYKFRGIDDIFNAISGLLAKNGLCILPRVISRECVERQTSAGKPLFYVACDMEFDFVCAEDGSTHTIKTFGEAMDSADKATNKAMSAAYKYAVILAFAIPTEGDNDADAQTHEVAAGNSKQAQDRKATEPRQPSQGTQKAGAHTAESLTALVAAGKAKEAAAWLSASSERVDSLWPHIAPETQDKLSAAWPA